MPGQPLFAGLIFDENDRQVETTLVGDEPCYVVDDHGFLLHIPSKKIDRQVLAFFADQIKGHEDLLSEQAAKMLGQEDIFTKAALENQFKNIDQQMDNLFQAGIPEDARMFLGMSGLKIVIDHHGDVVRIDQPSAPDTGDDGE
jgi:hypothetical protein